MRIVQNLGPNKTNEHNMIRITMLQTDSYSISKTIKIVLNHV